MQPTGQNPDPTSSPIGQGALRLPSPPLLVELLCPREAFEAIVSDYLTHIYPIYPLVYPPTFQISFDSRLFQKDPGFYRLCISLTAVTVASLPKRFSAYGCYPDTTPLGMVEKASHLVTLSKISEDRHKTHQAQIGDMICSYLLSVAFHYSGNTYAGWAHASDAILCMRTSALFRRESHESLDRVQSELCKRAFWMMVMTIM
jgi:hypothetical protein